LARTDTISATWATRIEDYLGEKSGTVLRLDVAGDASLSEVIKEARGRGAHRVMAVGDTSFVRWAAQAMVGSLMPLAPALLPGSRPLFGHPALKSASWQTHVANLLSRRFTKVDLAMGTVKPFVQQLVAGFPLVGSRSLWQIWRALFYRYELDLNLEIDRARIEGHFWCLVIANADETDGRFRWLPGADWSDQCLDLLLVRPRSLWQRWKFLRALYHGRHGALPGVIRYRCHRIVVQANQPWQYATDGGRVQDAANPLLLEARPEQLRLVVPPGS
jgi:hypothetical protein